MLRRFASSGSPPFRNLVLSILGPRRGFVRYIGLMFDVLAFVYENYWSGQACPEPDHLQRKLATVGFEADEIADALAWLGGLKLAAQHTQVSFNTAAGLVPTPLLTVMQHDGNSITFAKSALPVESAAAPVAASAVAAANASSSSLRVYSTAEQDHLGVECLGYVQFLENSQALPAQLREIVLDRAMAAPGCPLALDDLKIIVLMVYWSFGEEPDALVLDELCDDATGRIGH
jgi:Smg protein